MDCFGKTTQNAPCRNTATYGGFCHLHKSQTTFSQTEMHEISEMQKELKASYNVSSLLSELEVLDRFCGSQVLFDIELPQSSRETEQLLLSHKKSLTKKSRNIVKHRELDLEYNKAVEALKNVLEKEPEEEMTNEEMEKELDDIFSKTHFDEEEIMTNEEMEKELNDILGY